MRTVNFNSLYENAFMVFFYQTPIRNIFIFKILPNKKIAKKEIIKKGPKETLDFNPFLPGKSKKIPAIAPSTKLKRSQMTASEIFKNIPKGNASFTSPNPIPFRFVIRCKKSKAFEHRNPENK